MYHSNDSQGSAADCQGAGVSRRQFIQAAGAAAMLVATGVRAASADGKVNIGVLGPFTGPASRTGDAMKNGVRMAVADARKAGQLPLKLDGKPYEVELVWIDSQSDPEKAVKAVQSAITRQNVHFIMLGWHSSVAMAVMDAEAPYHVIQFGSFGESQFIAQKMAADPQKYRGWFKGFPSPPMEAALYGPPLNYFIDKKLWTPANRKAAILVEDTDYGRGWGEALQKSLKDAGFDVQPYDVTPLNATEFTPMLLKYKALNMSLVAMSTTASNSAANFVKQFHTQRLKALLIGHGLTWFSEWYKLTGNASNHVIAMDQPRAIAPWQFDWIKRYKARYHEEPSITPSGVSYDYARMAFKTISQVGSMDVDKLIPALQAARYKGIWNMYQFAKKAGDHALAPNEVMTGPFMEGFFFPMVQLMNGKTEIIWPLKYATAKFQQPPTI